MNQIHVKKFIALKICHIFAHVSVFSDEVADAATNLAKLNTNC